MKLTNLACKNAKPSNKPFKISDGGGLYLEVFPNGRKHWRFKYRFNNKENRIAFGLYPEVKLNIIEKNAAMSKFFYILNDSSLEDGNFESVIVQEKIIGDFQEQGYEEYTQMSVDLVERLEWFSRHGIDNVIYTIDEVDHLENFLADYVDTCRRNDVMYSSAETRIREKIDSLKFYYEDQQYEYNSSKAISNMRSAASFSVPSSKPESFSSKALNTKVEEDKFIDNIFSTLRQK